MKTKIVLYLKRVILLSIVIVFALNTLVRTNHPTWEKDEGIIYNRIKNLVYPDKFKTDLMKKYDLKEIVIDDIGVSVILPDQLVKQQSWFEEEYKEKFHDYIIYEMKPNNRIIASCVYMNCKENNDFKLEDTMNNMIKTLENSNSVSDITVKSKIIFKNNLHSLYYRIKFKRDQEGREMKCVAVKNKKKFYVVSFVYSPNDKIVASIADFMRNSVKLK